MAIGGVSPTEDAIGGVSPTQDDIGGVSPTATQDAVNIQGSVDPHKLSRARYWTNFSGRQKQVGGWEGGWVGVVGGWVSGWVCGSPVTFGWVSGWVSGRVGDNPWPGSWEPGQGLGAWERFCRTRILVFPQQMKDRLPENLYI